MFTRIAALFIILLTTNSLICQSSVGSDTAASPEMQLLTASEGWVLLDNHLFWTDSGGKKWSDITPSTVTQRIATVFFLNPDRGMVLIESYGSTGTGSVESFAIASTEDQGKTWTTHDPIPVSQIERDTYGGNAFLTFVDHEHGWLELETMTSANFRYGFLYSTSDGGVTWVELPKPPIVDKMSFASPEVGWITGGATQSELYQTVDGGRTWQAQALTPPKEAEGATQAFYGKPKFPADSRGVGFLPVTFNLPGEKSVFAVYETTRDDRSWHLRSSDANIPVSGWIPADAVDSTVVKVFRGKTGYITGDHEGNAAAERPASLPPLANPLEVSFFNRSHGWVLISGSSCDQFRQNCTTATGIFATSDGGKSLVNITPNVNGPASETSSPGLQPNR